jgi:hypothetical protein
MYLIGEGEFLVVELGPCGLRVGEGARLSAPGLGG